MCESGEWLKAYVEKLLREVLDDASVVEDDDGDFCFRMGTSAVYVRVWESGDRPLVRVFASAAWGLKPSAALLRELNELNARATAATIYVQEGVIFVDQTLFAASLDTATLAHAFWHVCSVAEDIGTLAAAMFDGHTPFPACEQAEAE